MFWNTVTDGIVGLTFAWIVWVVFDSVRRYGTDSCRRSSAVSRRPVTAIR